MNTETKIFPRIILITIDALRPDYFGCYGCQKDASPFLDGLAREGTKLNNVFATGPYSAASFPSILAAVYPAQYGDYIPLPPQVMLIPEILHQYDFKCAAFLSSVYMSRYYGYSKGFDYFQDYFAYERINKIKKSTKERLVNLLQKSPFIFGLIEKFYSRVKLLYKSEKMLKTSESAEKITDDALAWIKENSESSFFVWLHYMDTHIPYFFTEKYHKKFCPEISKKEMYQLDLKMRRAIHHKAELDEEEINKIKKMYQAAINYVDDNIKRVVDFLKGKGVYGETIIIVTSDHGEEFNEHGDVCHKSKAYDINLKVPTVLSQRISLDQDKMVSLIDLPRTIACLAGIKPPQNWQGINFIEENREFVYFENYHTKDRWVLDEFAKDKTKYFFRGIRTKEFKYIRDDLSGELLFDVKKDPGEKDNLINKKECGEIKEKLQKKLENFVKENTEKQERSPFEKDNFGEDNFKKEEEAKEERKKRLESLGYLD